ncbi:MAG: DUF6483 family protein [Oscillospiraceae bacterium]|jgi:hypothetical protein|nr:DUF6483 family protein [Oscillospiraceae bacterium]
MFKHDYVEEQIEILCKTIAAILFGSSAVKKVFKKSDEEDEVADPVGDRLLELTLDKFLADDVAKARRMLLSAVKASSSAGRLKIALEFYNKALEQGKLSKREAEEDLAELRKVYPIDEEAFPNED